MIRFTQRALNRNRVLVKSIQQVQIGRNYSNLFDQTLQFEPRQCSENDKAEVVLLHEPGIEALLGSLHASGSLFEKPVNLDKARMDHRNFKKVLTEHNMQVLDIRSVLARGCDRDLKARLDLEELAIQTLKYFDVDDGETKLYDEVPYLISNSYKRQCIEAMGVTDLIDVILLSPTVWLSPSKYNTPMKLESLQMKPLLNLTFTRDQQMVTNKGIVICNLGSKQREHESRIVKFCLDKLGLPLLGTIQAPGTVEGGDFIAAREDLCFIGTGLRTNHYAIEQMLKNNWFGTEKVAVVRDIFDCNQQRMHLDTIFNIASENCCVMLKSIMGTESSRRRLVTEYTFKPSEGKYVISKADVEFSQYVRDQGYHIIEISEEQQEAYGINFLNIGDNSILAVDESTARSILKDKHFKGNIEVIDFEGMTTMYGSVHCCSQVLKRSHQKESRSSRRLFDIDDTISAAVTPSPHSIKRPTQLTSSVLMIAPSYNEVENPRSNPEVIKKVIASRAHTLHDNDTRPGAHTDMQIVQTIRKEFADVHRLLYEHNIHSYIMTQYVSDNTPLASFPNHVISTHSGFETKSNQNSTVFYPISNENRRKERRKRRLGTYLEKSYQTSVDFYSGHEPNNHYLEGSAAMVYDRENLTAYVVEDPTRASMAAARDLCDTVLNYELVELHFNESYKMDLEDNIRENSHSHDGLTQRYLFIGDSFAVVCFEAFDETSQEMLRQSLQNTGKNMIIEISLDQAKNRASSMGLFRSFKNDNRHLFITTNSKAAMTEQQINQLESNVDSLVEVDLNLTEEITGLSLDSMICPLFHSDN